MRLAVIYTLSFLQIIKRIFKALLTVNKKLRIAGIVGALIVSAIILTSPSQSPPLPSPIVQSQDEGLLGIAIHPDFENNHFLYVYYTYSEGEQLWNKVLRIKESNNKISDA